MKQIAQADQGTTFDNQISQPKTWKKKATRTAITSGATWSACAKFELLWIENISLITNTGSLFAKMHRG